MPNTPIHMPAHSKSTLKKPVKHMTNFDKLVMVVSVVYPTSALPQALTVLGGNTAGVSALSWTGFLICSSLFLVYGIRHRVAPMIISNSLWVIMDALVIFGIFTSGNAITWL